MKKYFLLILLVLLLLFLYSRREGFSAMPPLPTDQFFIYMLPLCDTNTIDTTGQFIVVQGSKNNLYTDSQPMDKPPPEKCAPTSDLPQPPNTFVNMVMFVLVPKSVSNTVEANLEFLYGLYPELRSWGIGNANININTNFLS
jgi:hypothetical protein